MRTVLYAHDMEPITVVEVAPWLVQQVEQHRHAYIPVLPSYSALTSGEETPVAHSIPRVRIDGEFFVRHGQRHLMLFTHDEENALLLKSVFLPGQQRGVNDEKAHAFARGLLHGLQRSAG